MLDKNTKEEIRKELEALYLPRLELLMKNIGILIDNHAKEIEKYKKPRQRLCDYCVKDCNNKNVSESCDFYEDEDGLPC